MTIDQLGALLDGIKKLHGGADRFVLSAGTWQEIEVLFWREPDEEGNLKMVGRDTARIAGLPYHVYSNAPERAALMAKLERQGLTAVEIK